MSKRAKMSEPEEGTRTTTVGSYVQFRIDYEQIKQTPIGEAVLSDVVPAGGHLWRISCYPRGKSEIVNGEFEAFMMGADGKSLSNIQRLCETFEIGGHAGWYQFMKLADVEKNFLPEGHATFACTITVMDDCAIPVPPSDIGAHLGCLLDHTEGTDVSFIVGDERFPAHRAVLAARSSVFRAELFGSMAEATMPSIRLHDIAPATFKVMLRFIYTDELCAEDVPEDPSSTEMVQNLLAAADRYALDRLKLMCAQKLWDKVSIDTVANILACAETYSCPELKNKCMDFLVLEDNFRDAVFTAGYALLVLKFPSIAAEIKRRVRA